ncbi:hypothetical protein TNCV_2564961 [Trichonephila clavipes]|nr:hypothetical protein TNCV_2564961 [Trichonephila clavipes]
MLGGSIHGPKREIGAVANVSFNKSIVARAVDNICRLVGTTALDIRIVQIRNEKVSNHGSVPITIDCNVVAFIVFEEGFHQPIKRTKQSVFSGCCVVSTYTCGLASLQMRQFCLLT